MIAGVLNSQVLQTAHEAECSWLSGVQSSQLETASVSIRKSHEEGLSASASRGWCTHKSQPLACAAPLASVRVPRWLMFRISSTDSTAVKGSVSSGALKCVLP